MSELSPLNLITANITQVRVNQMTLTIVAYIFHKKPARVYIVVNGIAVT
jgi:hypothetical protein